MIKKTKKSLLYIITTVTIIVIFSLGALSGYFYFKKQDKSLSSMFSAASEEEKDVNIKFVLEVYDKIKENYWDEISDSELTNLFKLGSEKLTGGSYQIEPNNKEGLEKTLEEIIANYNEDQKKEFSATLSSVVLQNLNPIGRSGLYTTKDETSLKNTVQNINPEKDLYQDLGVGKDAPQEEIKKTYEEKVALLEKDQSAEAKEELNKINSSYQVLSDSNKRERYDNNGAEPTVFAETLGSNVFHIHLKRFSPVTFEEFQNEANKFNSIKGLDTLILDLRNNIGGSIDILQYFLGPFIGQDQYAYEFFHQNKKTPFKTKVGWLNSLVRYKKVIILINNKSQSTAELMAGVLKKYNVGVLIGEKTRGWGTIEKVFELDNQISENEKYSMFLVHTLTLRDDNQPIEGNGVDPTISISNPNWKKELLGYFNQNNLINIVEEIWNENPDQYY